MYKLLTKSFPWILTIQSEGLSMRVLRKRLMETRLYTKCRKLNKIHFLFILAHGYYT